MRDAARQVVTHTVEQMKADVQEHGLASRLLETGTDYARVVGDGALDLARENRKPLAGGAVVVIAGVAAWLLRAELADLAARLTGRSHPEQDAEAD